jgi:transcription-repair coupling factor (superfamily II helicase)
VHIDHGIGIFGGLEKIDINGRLQNPKAYQDNDLCISVFIHCSSKYKRKMNPRLYKLGTRACKLKQNTSKKIKDIARADRLYARRKMQRFAFHPILTCRTSEALL